MKVGDLVEFVHCNQQGKNGIIAGLTKPSELAERNPALRLYWVFYEEGVQCFTGNQLIKKGEN